MKDSYSFDLDAAGLDISYQKHYDAYCRIFDRCGLKYVVVEAHSGAMGGSQSHEFMVYTDAGEDFVVSCPSCSYAANLEKATSKLAPVQDLAPTGDGKPELVHTPGKGAIADVAEFLQVAPNQDIKVVAYMALLQDTNPKADQRKPLPVAVFLRGDHTVNEAKLHAVLTQALHESSGSGVNITEVRPMHPEEVQESFKAPGGFLGPVGLEIAQPMSSGLTVIVDEGLIGRENMICGANKLDYHLRNVTPGRDFKWNLQADVRNAVEGDDCPNCGGALKVAKAVEIGHIFKLGYKYSESMGARVLDVNGKEVTPIMGSYGIGMERILTSCIEQSNDENGFWLPASIAPFQVVVVPTNTTDEMINGAAIAIAHRLEDAGMDVLLDDRDERPGVKFKDADLVGIPYRVNVGKKLADGLIEVVTRATSTREDVGAAEVVTHLQKLLSQDDARAGKAASHP